MDRGLGGGACDGVRSLRRRRHPRHRSCAPDLHQWHDRTPQGCADAATVSARQPARVCLLARYFPAGRRPVLVARGLGMDRRPHGCAAADALLRAPHPGLSGAVRPERALALMAKYRVRNTFLFPTALKMMMKAVPEPRTR